MHLIFLNCSYLLIILDFFVLFLIIISISKSNLKANLFYSLKLSLYFIFIILQAFILFVWYRLFFHCFPLSKDQSIYLIFISIFLIHCLKLHFLQKFARFYYLIFEFLIVYHLFIFLIFLSQINCYLTTTILLIFVILIVYLFSINF